MKTFFEKLPNGTLVNYSLQDDGWSLSATEPGGSPQYLDGTLTTLGQLRKAMWQVYLERTEGSRKS